MPSTTFRVSRRLRRLSAPDCLIHSTWIGRKLHSQRTMSSVTHSSRSSTGQVRPLPWDAAAAMAARQQHVVCVPQVDRVHKKGRREGEMEGEKEGRTDGRRESRRPSLSRGHESQAAALPRSRRRRSTRTHTPFPTARQPHVHMPRAPVECCACVAFTRRHRQTTAQPIGTR